MVASWSKETNSSAPEGWNRQRPVTGAAAGPFWWRENCHDRRSDAPPSSGLVAGGDLPGCV